MKLKTNFSKTFEFFKYTLVYLAVLIIYLYYYTPPIDIVFYDIDSRRNIDEIIQIFYASSFYDFIFDTVFGNMLHYGRIYQILTFFLSFIFSFFINLDLHYLVLLSHFTFTFISFVIMTIAIFGVKNLNLLIVFALMFVDFSSNTMIKTTSIELFIVSLAIYFMFKENSRYKYYIYFFFGVLSAIKFTNIIYPIIYIFFDFKSKKFDFKKTFFSSLIGFVFGQPMILTRYGIKWTYEWVITMLNYNENYTVTRRDWIELLINEFSLLIVILGFSTLLLLKYKFNESFKFNLENFFLIISPIIQIVFLTNSTSLIRSHYLKLPYILLILGLLNLIKKKKLYSVVFLLIFSLSILFNFINTSKGNISLSNYFPYDNFTKTLLNQEDYLISNEIYDFVRNEILMENNGLIWWSPTKIFPYSKFHWGSTESPENIEIIIREAWGSSLKFSETHCSDYGGVAVLLFEDDEFIQINKNLTQKGFVFLKKYELNKSKENYFVFFKKEFELPYSC